MANTGIEKFFYIKSKTKDGKKLFSVFPGPKHYNLSKTATRVRYHTKVEAEIVCIELNNK